MADTVNLDEDLEERKKHEKKVKDLIAKLYGLHERLYSIRFDDSVNAKQKEIELTNLAAEIIKTEEKIAKSLNAAMDAFELQLHLEEIQCEDLFDAGSKRKREKAPKSKNTARRAHPPKKTTAEEIHDGGFMRTPSTTSLEDKNARGLWHSLSKMWSEWRYQTTVADAQYVTSRNPDLAQLDNDIAKLRAAIREMNQRKHLNKRDHRILADIKDQLKMRLQQKERYVRNLSADKQSEKKKEGKPVESTDDEKENKDSATTSTSEPKKVPGVNLDESKV